MSLATSYSIAAGSSKAAHTFIGPDQVNGREPDVQSTHFQPDTQAHTWVCTIQTQAAQAHTWVCMMYTQAAAKSDDPFEREQRSPWHGGLQKKTTPRWVSFRERPHHLVWVSMSEWRAQTCAAVVDNNAFRARRETGPERHLPASSL